MINTNVEKPEVFEPVFSNFVEKLIQFDKWVESNKKKIENENTNNRLKG